MAEDGKRFHGIHGRREEFKDPYSLANDHEIALRLGLPGEPNDPDFLLPQQMEEEALKRAAHERRIESEKARYSTFGMVARPEEPSLWGYKYTLRHNTDLKFSATNYGLFDGRIVKACGVDEEGRSTHAAFNRNHDYNEDFAPLRRNLALLRNYLLTQYPPEGKHAQENIRKVQMMGDELGKALVGGAQPFLFQRWLHSMKNLATGQNMSKPYVSKFMEHASVPDKGIVYMYNYLHKLEHKNPLNAFSSEHHWKLEGLEKTPFSDEYMKRDSRSSNMWRVTEGFDLVASQLGSVDKLTENQKEVSVEEAHKILDNLRVNIAAGEDKKVDVQDPVVHEARGLLVTVIAYRDALATLVRYDPNLLLNPDIMEANEAVEKLSYKMKEQEKEMLKQEERPELAHKMDDRMKQTPAKNKSKDSTQKLLARIDQGFKHLTKVDNQMKVKKRTIGLKAEKEMGLPASARNIDVSKVRSGMDGTMSGYPKVLQVSGNNPDAIEVAQKINALEPQPLVQKETGGNSRGKS